MGALAALAQLAERAPVGVLGILRVHKARQVEGVIALGRRDVPVSSAVVSLPLGPHSALSPYGRLCGAKLTAPTTLIAQDGAKIVQRSPIGVTGCPIETISHRLRRGRMLLTVWVPEAGRLSVSGRGLRSEVRRVEKAGDLTLSLPPAPGGRKVKLRLAFRPSRGRNTSAVTLALRVP